MGQEKCCKMKHACSSMQATIAIVIIILVIAIALSVGIIEGIGPGNITEKSALYQIVLSFLTLVVLAIGFAASAISITFAKWGYDEDRQWKRRALAFQIGNEVSDRMRESFGVFSSSITNMADDFQWDPTGAPNVDGGVGLSPLTKSKTGIGLHEVNRLQFALALFPRVANSLVCSKLSVETHSMSRWESLYIDHVESVFLELKSLYEMMYSEHGLLKLEDHGSLHPKIQRILCACVGGFVGDRDDAFLELLLFSLWTRVLRRNSNLSHDESLLDRRYPVVKMIRSLGYHQTAFGGTWECIEKLMDAEFTAEMILDKFDELLERGCKDGSLLFYVTGAGLQEPLGIGTNGSAKGKEEMGDQ